MVLDFTERIVVDNAVIEETAQEISLNVSDRCDACGAQAYVLAIGVSGELLFCAHHYNSIISTNSGKNAIESFAFRLVDEREKLAESK
jgi:hypothetical protein